MNEFRVQGDMGKVNGFYPEDVDLCRSWAKTYQGMGWLVLPTRSDDKRPAVKSYAQWWEGGEPSVDDLWREHPSGSCQVGLGTSRNLLVIDLDGPEGIEAFAQMCADKGVKTPYTWKTTNDRTQGMHLWFSIPRKFRTKPIRKRRLWGKWDDTLNQGKGGWSPRANIELLCDGSLVMAPPSIHPKRGTRYKFFVGCSPREITYPAPIPLWLLLMPSADVSIRPKPPQEAFQKPQGRFRNVKPQWLPCSPGEVLRGIQDKTSLVKSWGLRVPNRLPNEAGWIKCHDIDRPDNDPSASFNPTTGSFWRPDVGTVCLFRLAVELNIYADWRAACTDLAQQYLPHLFRNVPRK